MNDIIIREAQKEDLPALLNFEQGIIAAERPIDPTLRKDHYQYYDLPEMLEADNATIFVAQIGDELIGSGNVRIKPANHYNSMSEYAYIGLMYTAPDHRGKGVARLILDAIKKWALQRGHKELRLNVFAGNISAVHAYEKYGFTKNLTEMRMNAEE